MQHVLPEGWCSFGMSRRKQNLMCPIDTEECNPAKGHIRFPLFTRLGQCILAAAHRQTCTGPSPRVRCSLATSAGRLVLGGGLA